jgi:two-component system phosphate regulon sensor histidine kinase PhoR
MAKKTSTFRVRYLFWGMLLLTALVTGVQVYLLVQQFDKTSRLTRVVLDESLNTAINIYQLDRLQEEEQHPLPVNTSRLVTIPGAPVQRVTVSSSVDSLASATRLVNSFITMVSRGTRALPVRLAALDSIYGRVLDEKGYRLEHDMQLLARDGEVLERANSLLERSSGRLVAGTPLPLSLDRNVRVLFKNPVTLVWQQMAGTIAASAVMLALMVACLLYYLSVISRQNEVERAREDFVHVMTHELRNPLQSAIALSGMLGHEGVRGDEKWRGEVLRRVQDNLSDINTQITILLALSDDRRGTIHPGEHDLGEMLEEVTRAYALLADKPVRFDLRVTPDPCCCRYDAVHLANAVRNLVDNAIKYSGDEVTITLRAVLSPGKCVIRVTDDGDGIPAAALPRVFDKYYRVPRAARPAGFGLGLSYVKWVAGAHGGCVRVESREGAGSTFEIEIKIPCP